MMKENSQSGRKKETEINIVDLFFYLLYHWKWYVLSLLVCVGLAYVRYSKTEKVYSSSLKVYIKDLSGNGASYGPASTVGLDKYKNSINRVDVSSEILKLQSKNLLRQAVYRLHADISYKVKKGILLSDLYKQSPVSVCFIDSVQNPAASFVVKLKDYRTVQLSSFNGEEGKTLTAVMNERIETPVGRIILRPTPCCMPVMFNIPIHVTKLPIGEVVHACHENMMVNQNMDGTDNPTSVLTVTMHDSSPLRAQDMLNALVTVYNEEARRDKNKVALNTANFINNRIDIIGRELGGVESNLASFQSSNKMLDMSSSVGMYMGQSQKYSQNIEDAETQLHLAEFMRAYLTNPSKSSELIPSNIGIKDMDIETQINQYNTLKLRRDKLSEENSDYNPVVLDLNKTLHALRKSIVRTVDNVISGLRMQKNEATGRGMHAQAKVATLPLKQKEFLSIERQQKIKDDLYTYLLNKREENILMQAMVDDNAQIIDTSDNDFYPISPRRNMNILLGVLLGLFVPTLVFLMKMFLDTKVRSRKDIEDNVTVPFLGVIPQNKEVSATIGQENAYSIVAEAFRVLRTNMAFLLNNKTEAHVITVSSFSEGSGKTFVVTHLAQSLMMNKKSVLLIDLDIRKGTISHIYHLEKPGMTDYLADYELTMEDIIHRNPDGNMPDMIGAGSIAPNPAELLMSSRLDELISEIRKRYDYIVVDNVPVGMLADGSIMNRIMDMTIFVIRAGKLDRRQLPDVEQLYSDKKLNNMGIVLNGSKFEHRKYGYGYSYDYGYTKNHKKTFFGLFSKKGHRS